MVFKHEIDPSHGDAAHQEILAQAHKGKSILDTIKDGPRHHLTGDLLINC